MRSGKTLAAVIEASIDLDSLEELGRATRQKDIPAGLRITRRSFEKMRGRHQPLVFDDFPPGSPEAIAHAKLPGFKRNFYKLNGLDENSVKKVIHYYPGTPFVSHAGIISVERENGVPRIYVFDSVPGKSGDQEDARYPSGIRKISIEDFFGTNEAYYGVIVRPTQVDAEGMRKAAAAAERRFEAAQTGTQDLFDYTFDWRQDDKVACSPFVWRAYVDGPGVNLLSDISMALIPAWVIRKKTDYAIRMNFQITPQALLTSLYTQRVVDFDSKGMEPLLRAVSEGGHGPLPLPSKDYHDPATGHVMYWAP